MSFPNYSNAKHQPVQPITFMDESINQTPIPIGYGQAIYPGVYGYIQSASPEMHQYMTKKSIDTLAKMKENEFKHSIEMEEMNQLFQLRTQLEERKTENAIRREKGMELRKRKRELASYSIFENSDYNLCMEIKYTDEEREYTKPLLSCSYIRGEKICDMENGEVKAWILTVGRLKERIVLTEDQINVKDFSKILEKNGITLTVGRERRKMVLELIFSYLIEKSPEIELPLSQGWNRKKGGIWIFCGDASKSVKGIKEGKYYHG